MSAFDESPPPGSRCSFRTTGSFTPVTDFGERPTIIAREVSWAPDGGSIYAAVAKIQGDIVALDGLI